MYEGLRRSSGRAVRQNLSHMDKLSIQLAGLCHDLGHGPFSHVFDNEFLPRRHAGWDPKNAAWNHEAMSADMFEWMVEDNHIDVDGEVVKRVRDLITSNDADAPADKKFLWDIVANKRNSVDVDKSEYIMRDAYNTNVKGSVDISRLMSFMKVIDDKICFKASEVYNVYELFHTRASLHQKVYTHKKQASNTWWWTRSPGGRRVEQRNLERDLGREGVREARRHHPEAHRVEQGAGAAEGAGSRAAHPEPGPVLLH